MASEPSTAETNQLTSVWMADGDQVLSIPRGGPIYLPNFVSPLTTAPQFETAVLQELRNLNAELDVGLDQLDDANDLCVDDLKIFTEEELAEMAIKELLKDGEHVEVTSRQMGERSNSRDLVSSSLAATTQLVYRRFTHGPKWKSNSRDPASSSSAATTGLVCRRFLSIS